MTQPDMIFAYFSISVKEKKKKKKFILVQPISIFWFLTDYIFWEELLSQKISQMKM